MTNHAHEKLLLSAFLRGPKEILNQAVTAGVSVRTFTKTEHRLVYGALAVLPDTNGDPRAVRVAEYLRKAGDLDLAGGPYGIMALETGKFVESDIPAIVRELIGLQHAREAREQLPPEVRVQSDVEESRPNETDLGNAERFLTHFGDQLRHCAAWNSWMIWDGKRWLRDRDGRVMRFAVATVREMYTEASRIEDPQERGQRGKHAVRSEAQRRIAAFVELAKTDRRVAVLPEAFDSHERCRYLLNVENGTIDIRTGELGPHRREDLITRLAPVTFDPNARSERWEKFLERALPDAEVRAFLQRFVGSCLTGDASDRHVLLAYGPGANGKSVLAGVLSNMLGDYVHAARFDSFLECRPAQAGGARSDLMALRGARLVTAMEANPGRHLNEAMLKSFAGGPGDRITARGLYERDDTTFPPEGKLLLVCNHRPKVKGGGDAIWARLLEVPFSVVIPKAERDPHLVARLCEDLSGVLTWALDGARAWWSTTSGDRLAPPDAVMRATKAYRQGEDPLSDFVTECCVLETKTTTMTTTKDLWDRYVNWCKDAGELVKDKPPISRRDFTNTLKHEHGCEPVRIGHTQARGLAGIRLVDGDGRLL